MTNSTLHKCYQLIFVPNLQHIWDITKCYLIAKIS